MMSSRNGLPELLAPAGSRKAFLGALAAGADAVYLGGEKFGARAYAENFTQEDIVRSIREAHILGKKVYLTLNVLTKESELEETVDFAMSLWREGLDGVIVQDPGVLRVLHERCPGLELHASTQMSCAGPEAVRFLKKLGVRRVVPARELSLEEIRTIKREEPVEIECFIHGAMCYSYSGRCLMSSFLGGRSGNRGRCAGTCRLPYSIIDADGKEIALGKGKEQYPISMRDLCVLEILPDLIDAGIDSFKIEGRMKSPHYAAGVTALYRKYMDFFRRWDAEGRKKPWKIAAEDMRRLKSLYLRTDLSTGYYYKRNGKELLTITKPGYAGTDEELLGQIEEKYLSGLPARAISGLAVLAPGREAKLTVSAPDLTGNGETITVTATGEVVQSAVKRPMEAPEIEKRLRKTGDSLFAFDKLEVDVTGDVFLPVASLNALRREALSLLEEEILERAKGDRTVSGRDTGVEKGSTYRQETAGGENGSTYRPEPSDGENGSTYRPEPAGNRARGEIPEVWAQVTTEAQLRAAQECGVTNIIVEETPQIMEALTGEERRTCLIALPHICRTDSRDSVRKLAGMGFAGVLVRNPEELDILEEIGYDGCIVADGSLYQWNTAARDLLLARCDYVNAGWELSSKDMLPLMEGARGRQLLSVYGRIPMMISAGCVRKTAGKCVRKEQAFFSLRDRKGMQFPVRCVCAHCYNVIYNSLPLSLHSFVRKGDRVAMGAAGWICSFTEESGEQTKEVLRWYCSGGASADPEAVFRDFTTGHYRKSAL